jgi:hypothetical protein
VLAHEDPGICNWLDTMGLACGVMAFRSYRAEHLEAPRTRLLKQSEIAGALPNARRCGPEERRRQIAERRNGVAHLLCD